MGVLMTRRKVTRDEAFDLLRVTSQHSNRKVRDIALDVIEQGELPECSSSMPRTHAGPATA
jgi:AmiR/NasT family two-component response regulator